MQNDEAIVDFSSYSDSKPIMVPGPDNPPWNVAAAIGFWLLSVFLIVLVPALLLLPYVYSTTHSLDSNSIGEIATKDPTAILIQILAIIPVHLITLLVAWPIITKLRRYPVSKILGFAWGGARWWHFVLILAGFYFVAAVVGHYAPEQNNDMIRMISSSKWALYSVALLAVLTAPITEEVIYRGVLYSAFQRPLGKTAAVILVTIFFALVHVPQYWGSPSTIALITLLSFVLTVMRMWTGNLLPAIVLHTVFNGLQALALLLSPPVSPGPNTPVEQVSLFLKSLF